MSAVLCVTLTNILVCLMHINEGLDVTLHIKRALGVKPWPCKDLWPRIDHILYPLRYDMNLTWTNGGLLFNPKRNGWQLYTNSETPVTVKFSSFFFWHCHLPPANTSSLFLAKAPGLTSAADGHNITQDTSLLQVDKNGCATRLGLSVVKKEH